jgi:predicted O-methyltransferase YrrM
LSQEALEWLFAAVSEHSRTLETGCGYSTVAFALRQTDHVAISPEAAEHAGVLDWCAQHGVNTDRIRFIAAMSQDVLPTLELAPLDLILVDGSHSFPMPFIDWYYGARGLRAGGLLILDDVDIITPCRILRDFLQAEAGRWRHVRDIGHTAVFQKLTDHAMDAIRWRDQPYSAAGTEGLGARRMQS